jgi:aryl-alcohol dehydrogenase-like predicted oxidoreductase
LILVGQASACLVLIFATRAEFKRRQAALHDVQGEKPALLLNRVPFRFEISSNAWQELRSAEERASQMNKRKLGKTGMEISPLVFGGNIFGWTVDQATSFKLLDAFVAAGFNSVDTADVYSKWVPGHAGGESEIILGEWMNRTGNRSKIIVATKVGMDMGDVKKGLSKSYILASAENSLRRLQTDYIDLYQSHIDDPDTPLEETLGAYADLIKQGKVRAIGASNHKAERLAAALETSKKYGLPAYQALQPNYSLIERAEYESHLEPLCEKEGIGVINYFPLAGGFLSGKYRSESDAAGKARARNVTKYLNDRGFKILDALDKVAKRYNATPARISLAWLLARPSVTAPIVSATNLDQLNDLISSVELALDRDSIEFLNHASE